MSRRKVKRETREAVRECGQYRPMMFEYNPSTGHLETWPKGTRRRVVVPLVACWQRAMKREADERKSKRRKRRAAK